MAKLIACSQSSLLLPQLQSHATIASRRLSFVNCEGVARAKSLVLLTSSSLYFHKGICGALVPKASSLDVELPEATVGGGDEGGGKDRDGGDGGRGGGGGGDDGGNKGDEGSDEGDAKKSNALLMSQRFTLAYAALVGLGGFMGYLKSGSQKSLAAGGLSSLLLYYVYTELPKRPVFASSIGLGLSAALLVVMGSRFKKSGKVFPAGIVSLVSLVMTGGYMHGIMKTAH